MIESNANKPDEKPSFTNELIVESQKPLTVKDRFVGFVIAAGMLGLAGWMFARPVLFTSETSEVGRHRTAGGLIILDLAWSRPVAVGVALLALLVVWGSLTKPSAPPAV